MTTKALKILLSVICGATVTIASALPTSHYATTSRLASGKWVKIAIPASGVYQLTYDELRAMGFSSPASVHVYGHGGNAMSEVITADIPDDLTAVPVMRYGEKLIFYGRGPVNVAIGDLYSTTYSPNFQRTFNGYDTQGYYFLSESGSETTVATEQGASSSDGVEYDYSYDYVLHEQELVSLSRSGRDILGENIGNDTLWIDYSLPQYVEGTTIGITTAAASNSTATNYLRVFVHSGGARDSLLYALRNCRIYGISSGYVYYNTATAKITQALTSPKSTGKLEIFFSHPNATMKCANLDYVMFTYQRNNVIADGSYNQMRLCRVKPTSTDKILMPGASATTVVWNIDDPQTPVRYATQTYDGGYMFIPGLTAGSSQYIAFDPAKELMSIGGYQSVANQNLHATTVPDLLIVTNDYYKAQAQRVADLHIAEGMDVAVVDQEQIFNEFSSGTRDAMGVRMFCKMLWDRDAANNHKKFRYLLMFGPGTYDNRSLTAQRDNMLITYETASSYNEDNSYVTDDFFGILNDGSGSAIQSDTLCLGVGRIPCRTLEEARSDVDKLIKYVTEPDYGVWRNNIMAASDEGDNNLHTFQSEGILELVDTELGMTVVQNRVHNAQYPKAVGEDNLEESRRTAANGRQHWYDLSVSGQFFMTYVGHAGPPSYTKYSNMWTIPDVNRTAMERLPIMSTACCDVARYDSDSRGIAETAFHKADGGAVAMLTTSRSVYASYNDRSNRGFARGLFAYDKATGEMPRLGDALKASKYEFLGESNHNKMSFFLLGDPAMQVHFPKPLFKITKLNSTNVTDTSARCKIYPLQRLSVTAQVMKLDGSGVNTDFNGDATLTVYDYAPLFGTVSGRCDGSTVSRNIYYERATLCQATGRVTNGIFTGEVVLPRDVKATGGQQGLVSVYAHQDNTAEMVSGASKQLLIYGYNSSQATKDDEAPVITSMYMGDDEATFDASHLTTPSTMFHATATDNLGLNVGEPSVNAPTLILDAGKENVTEVKSYITMGDGGLSLTAALPMEDLELGQHSLTLTVTDVAGNSTSKTINFNVAEDYNGVLTVSSPQATDNVQLDFTSDLETTPQVTVKVLDALGNLVWSRKSSSFPMTWNLTDSNGKRLPGGIYSIMGTYESGTAGGGTPITTVTILDPHF